MRPEQQDELDLLRYTRAKVLVADREYLAAEEHRRLRSFSSEDMQKRIQLAFSPQVPDTEVFPSIAEAPFVEAITS